MTGVLKTRYKRRNIAFNIMVGLALFLVYGIARYLTADPIKIALSLVALVGLVVLLGVAGFFRFTLKKRRR